MRITVRAKPKSKRPGVTRRADGVFVVAVAEAAHRGAANRAVVRALAEYLGVAPSAITLVSGAAGRDKIFDIP